MHVEVIIQGNASDVDFLYKGKPPFELVRIDNNRNLGMGRPITDATNRFMDSDYRWFMRLDDDIELNTGVIDKAIKLLERKQEEGSKIDRVMIANQFSKPVMFKLEKKQGDQPLLIFERGKCIEKGVNRKTGKARWFMCDFVDTGCTIFDKEAIRAGCRPDPQFFVGAFSDDYGWNAHLLGFKSLLYAGSRVNHFARECRSEGHERVRRSTRLVRENSAKFAKKWNVQPAGTIEFKSRYK